MNSNKRRPLMRIKQLTMRELVAVARLVNAELTLRVSKKIKL